MPSPKFNLSSTRSRILKNWRQFRGVRNRDIWYMRKHPTSLLAISRLLGKDFRSAIDKVPSTESRTARMRVHLGDTASDEESSLISDGTQYEDAITIHDSDSILSLGPNLELESTLEPASRSQSSSETPPCAAQSNVLDPRARPQAACKRRHNPTAEEIRADKEEGSTVKRTVITKSAPEFRDRYARFISIDVGAIWNAEELEANEVPIGVWRPDPMPKRIATARIGEQGIVYTIRNWTREMDQIEPGDGYEAKADTPVSEANWFLVLNKIDLFPVLSNHPETVSSQDNFSAWLFSVLADQHGLENQAWMDADDMRLHPWLNVMYHSLDRETEVSRPLLSCHSDEVGVQVACCLRLVDAIEDARVAIHACHDRLVRTFYQKSVSELEVGAVTEDVLPQIWRKIRLCFKSILDIRRISRQDFDWKVYTAGFKLNNLGLMLRFIPEETDRRNGETRPRIWSSGQIEITSQPLVQGNDK